MAVVSGGASSGKSSLVRLASRLAGRALTEVALSAATDTTELLGCFEQSEPSRLLHAALRAVGEMSADASLSLLTIIQRHREADEACARRLHEALRRSSASNDADSESEGAESDARENVVRAAAGQFSARGLLRRVRSAKSESSEALDDHALTTDGITVPDQARSSEV